MSTVPRLAIDQAAQLRDFVMGGLAVGGVDLLVSRADGGNVSCRIDVYQCAHAQSLSRLRRDLSKMSG